MQTCVIEQNTMSKRFSFDMFPCVNNAFISVAELSKELKRLELCLEALQVITVENPYDPMNNPEEYEEFNRKINEIKEKVNRVAKKYSEIRIKILSELGFDREEYGFFNIIPEQYYRDLFNNIEIARYGFASLDVLVTCLELLVTKDKEKVKELEEIKGMTNKDKEFKELVLEMYNKIDVDINIDFFKDNFNNIIDFDKLNKFLEELKSKLLKQESNEIKTFIKEIEEFYSYVVNKVILVHVIVKIHGLISTQTPDPSCDFDANLLTAFREGLEQNNEDFHVSTEHIVDQVLEIIEKRLEKTSGYGFYLLLNLWKDPRFIKDLINKVESLKKELVNLNREINNIVKEYKNLSNSSINLIILRN